MKTETITRTTLHTAKDVVDFWLENPTLLRFQFDSANCFSLIIDNDEVCLNFTDVENNDDMNWSIVEELLKRVRTNWCKSIPVVRTRNGKRIRKVLKK